MSKGLITCLIAGEYTIYDMIEKTYHKGKPRGVLRIKESLLKVGDYVEYENISGCVTITKKYERKTDLLRPSVANIEQAFVVFSVKEPVINLNLLDRFLTILEFNQIKPIIVFNKWDLIKDENELEEVEKIAKYYESLNYQILKTSTKNSLLDELIDLIKGHVSVITGQSGVGKSSLLNCIDDSLNLSTNEISKALNRGKHTTRHVELINIKEGWIADTPGFGIMDFDGMEKEDISHSFIEFFEASKKCKYNGCMHLNEPSCEVKRLIGQNVILKSRYENYQQFLEEIKKRKKW